MKFLTIFALLISFHAIATPLEELHLRHLSEDRIRELRKSGLSDVEINKRTTEIKAALQDELAEMILRDTYRKIYEEKGCSRVGI